MVDLRSRDPDAARALLDDMRGVAQERGEAALWEPWATAAANLMVDLRSRDPAAARALLDDMRGVAQARGEARSETGVPTANTKDRYERNQRVTRCRNQVQKRSALRP